MSALGSVPGVFFTPLFGVIVCLAWLCFALVFGYGLYIKGSYDSKLNQYDFVNIEYDEE